MNADKIRLMLEDMEQDVKEIFISMGEGGEGGEDCFWDVVQSYIHGDVNTSHPGQSGEPINKLPPKFRKMILSILLTTQRSDDFLIGLELNLAHFFGMDPEIWKAWFVYMGDAAVDELALKSTTYYMDQAKWVKEMVKLDNGIFNVDWKEVLNRANTIYPQEDDQTSFIIIKELYMKAGVERPINPDEEDVSEETKF